MSDVEEERSRYLRGRSGRRKPVVIAVLILAGIALIAGIMWGYYHARLTVHYDLNGGSGTMADETFERSDPGDFVPARDNVWRDGWAFRGWSLDEGDYALVAFQPEVRFERMSYEDIACRADFHHRILLHALWERMPRAQGIAARVWTQDVYGTEEDEEIDSLSCALLTNHTGSAKGITVRYQLLDDEWKVIGSGKETLGWVAPGECVPSVLQLSGKPEAYEVKARISATDPDAADSWMGRVSVQVRESDERSITYAVTNGTDHELPQGSSLRVLDCSGEYCAARSFPLSGLAAGESRTVTYRGSAPILRDEVHAAFLCPR